MEGGAKSPKRIPAVGTKLQVWRGEAKHTAGGLTKSKLMMNKKSGKVVSKAKHNLAVRNKIYERIKEYTIPKGTKNPVFDGSVQRRSRRSRK